MKKLEITAYDLAERFIGIAEVPGTASNPMVLAMLRLDDPWPSGDEVPWCSAFMNYVAWLLRLPRSKSLRARSWLLVGEAIPVEDAEVGFDVVILRSNPAAPGPEVIEAPGHVAFFGGAEGESVWLLGGNQGDRVNLQRFSQENILGIRRIGG